MRESYDDGYGSKNCSAIGLSFMTYRWRLSRESQAKFCLRPIRDVDSFERISIKYPLTAFLFVLALHAKLKQIVHISRKNTHATLEFSGIVNCCLFAGAFIFHSFRRSRYSRISACSTHSSVTYGYSNWLSLLFSIEDKKNCSTKHGFWAQSQLYSLQFMYAMFAAIHKWEQQPRTYVRFILRRFYSTFVCYFIVYPMATNNFRLSFY